MRPSVLEPAREVWSTQRSRALLGIVSTPAAQVRLRPLLPKEKNSSTHSSLQLDFWFFRRRIHKNSLGEYASRRNFNKTVDFFYQRLPSAIFFFKFGAVHFDALERRFSWFPDLNPKVPEKCRDIYWIETAWMFTCKNWLRCSRERGV